MLINRLPEIIEELGITQKHLCKKTGLSASRMSAIVNSASCDLENAILIAKAIGRPVEEIWEQKKEEPTPE